MDGHLSMRNTSGKWLPGDPETNSEFTPENGWLEYDKCFLLGQFWPIFQVLYLKMDGWNTFSFFFGGNFGLFFKCELLVSGRVFRAPFLQISVLCL